MSKLLPNRASETSRLLRANTMFSNTEFICEETDIAAVAAQPLKDLAYQVLGDPNVLKMVTAPNPSLAARNAFRNAERQKPVRTERSAKLLVSVFVKVLKRPGIYRTSPPPKCSRHPSTPPAVPSAVLIALVSRSSPVQYTLNKQHQTHYKTNFIVGYATVFRTHKNSSYHSKMALGPC